MLTSATSVVLGLTDTALLGHRSTAALSVAALVVPIWIFCNALVSPWGSATQVLVARWHGAGDADSIRALARTGLAVSSAIAVVCTMVAAAVAPTLVALTAPVGLDRTEAQVMLWILLCGLPFGAATAHLRGLLAGTGDTLSGARNAVGVAVLNSALSAVLIFGAGLGPVGSGIGSTISVAVGTGGLWARAATRFRRSEARAAREVLRAWIALAVPDVAFAVVSYGCDAFVMAVAARTGAVNLAAHRVLTLVISMVWMLVFGIGVAISVLVGQRLGAGDDPGRRAYVRAGSVLMFATSCTAALLLAITAPEVLQVFTTDHAVSTAAISVVWSLPAMAPIMAIGTIYAAQLRAAGDTQGVMYASLFSVSCVTLPAVWVCCIVYHRGLPGLYFGVLVGWIARTIATYIRCRARPAD